MEVFVREHESSLGRSELAQGIERGIEQLDLERPSVALPRSGKLLRPASGEVGQLAELGQRWLDEAAKDFDKKK